MLAEAWQVSSCMRVWNFPAFLVAGHAFVSLATNDDYAMGALALGRSLRDAYTSKTLVLLVTNGVSSHARYINEYRFADAKNFSRFFYICMCYVAEICCVPNGMSW